MIRDASIIIKFQMHIGKRTYYIKTYLCNETFTREMLRARAHVKWPEKILCIQLVERTFNKII